MKTSMEGKANPFAEWKIIPIGQKPHILANSYRNTY